MSTPMKKKQTMRQRIAATIRGTREEEIIENYGDIVLFGMANVGKTSIVNRFVNNFYSRKYLPTSNQETFEVSALIHCDEHESQKTMLFKKDFKSSVMGTPKNNPVTVYDPSTSVITLNQDAGNQSSAYTEGKHQGMRTLLFNLVDTPPDLPEMEPFTYRATVANAKGFLLVCSFDVEGSLEFLEEIHADIEEMRSGKGTPIILVANKSDISEEDRIWDESEMQEVAEKLSVEYCMASLVSQEGCQGLTKTMLTTIKTFADDEKYENSLAEDYAYYRKDDEK